MATGLYDKGREGILDHSIDMTATVKCVLVDTAAYTPNFATDQFLSDIAVGARIATSSALTTKTYTAGVFNSDPASFTGVTGASVEAMVMYIDTGNPATSRLICFIDNATGFPFTPSGGDVQVVPSTGANKWFKL